MLNQIINSIGAFIRANITQTGGNTLVADDAVAGTTVPLPVGGFARGAVAAYTALDRATFGFNLVGGAIVGGLDLDDAAATASYPVAVGGKYNLALPIYADGDRAQAQFGTRGSLHVEIFGSNTTSNVAVSTPSDGASVQTALFAVSYPVNFNGTNFDRARNNSAANLSATTQPFAQAVAEPGQWTGTHEPAVATQATYTKAAGGAGVRHVAQALQAAYFSGTTPNAVRAYLRDGAAGVGTIIWRAAVPYPGALSTYGQYAQSGLNIFGSANTAMTWEFSGVAATDFALVSLAGYSTI